MATGHELFFWILNKLVKFDIHKLRDWQNDPRQRIVVVGNGPVGMRVAEQLSLSRRCVVIVIGNEPSTPYNRVHLSSVLAGQRNLEEIYTDEYIKQRDNVTLLSGHIRDIDRTHKFVEDRQGRRFSYDQLVLAVGSKPAVPSIPGVDLQGVFAFRSLADVASLMARRVRSRHTVVLGGGLLGVEAARGMCQNHTDVTLIEHNTHLLFNQLDRGAARLLCSGLAAQGIQIRTRSRVRMVLGTSSVEGVVLEDNSEVACDTLVLATGIRPNISLAQRTGLAFGRGITVDTQMRTSDPSIYAIGECAEFEGRTYGFVAPGYEQASIASSTILDGTSHYAHPVMATSLKVVDSSVATIGNANDADPSVRAIVYADNHIYRRLNLRRGRIVGALAVGDWSDLVQLKDTIASQRRISPLQQLRFRLEGELLRPEQRTVAQLPDTAVICNCNAVTKSTIQQAIQCGATSVDDIATETRAGSTCGTCKPLLAQMADNPSVPSPNRFATTILAICGIAAALALMAVLAPALPYADSATHAWHWDVLWTTSEYKQASGFTLLGLGLAGAILTLRKRAPALNRLGNFDGWRIFHLTTGVLCLVGLLVHTGFRFGSNINFYLMTTFTALSVAGLIMGLAMAFEHRLAQTTAARVRRLSFLVHLGLCWPLPALLTFHVFKTYYF